MAVDYQDLFGNLGKIIVWVNEATARIGDWDDAEREILDSFEASEQEVAVHPLIETVDSIQSSLASLRPTLSQICDLRLQDYDSVVGPLLIPQNDIQSVLRAIIFDFVTTSNSVRANVVTVGTVTAGSLNQGNGTVLITDKLDGSSVPIAGGSAHPSMLNRLTELSVSETITVRCTSDSYADGLTAGEEQFSISGQLPLDSAWAEGVPGSGNGPSMGTLQAGAILQNMNFEEWSVTDTPDSWDIISGAVTTNIARESNASNIYRGTYGLKLIGTDVAIVLSQSIPVSSLVPLQRYCLSLRYKATATEVGKDFIVVFEGTNYNQTTGELFQPGSANLATSWTLAYFFVTMPSEIPSDFALKIKWYGATEDIYIDDIGFAPVVWHNGLGFVAVAGFTPFTKEDLFTSAVVNSNSGIIQSFFVRNYGVQLPSSVASPTISDNLAM